KTLYGEKGKVADKGSAQLEEGSHQLDLLQNLIGPTILTNLEDRWVWDLNGKGVFRVKDLRNLLDESFLPKDSTATRWVKSIPIKINVFAWKVYLDRLPT
nr:RNA-directed DNA polymerase, eukaryota [Tanacetum cinerariifolium]